MTAVCVVPLPSNNICMKRFTVYRLVRSESNIQTCKVDELNKVKIRPRKQFQVSVHPRGSVPVHSDILYIDDSTSIYNSNDKILIDSEKRRAKKKFTITKIKRNDPLFKIENKTENINNSNFNVNIKINSTNNNDKKDFDPLIDIF